MVIYLSRYIISIALNSLTYIYLFSNFGSNNLDSSEKI
jgi:hypothetical protein